MRPCLRPRPGDDSCLQKAGQSRRKHRRHTRIGLPYRGGDIMRRKTFDTLMASAGLVLTAILL
ncbi:MAG: hypothetical protein ACTHMW_01640, partial [Actinomycetes bacterium]